MKSRIFVVSAVFALTLLSAGSSPAADIPLVRTARPAAITVRPYTSVRRVSFRRYGVKLIGMPCVLPPDVIVARNWNGPQCRYVDNIILPARQIVFVSP
jgi:hypothetical protein